jgi:PAS domain S-box-containing protein
MKESRRNYFFFIAFGLALSILLIIAFVSYQNSIKFIETSRLVAHTYKVLDEFNEVQKQMLDVETAYRGFTITGVDSFLQPYYTALGSVAATTRSLRMLTSDSPDLQGYLDSLEIHVTNKLDHAKNVITSRRKEGFASAYTLTVSGRGKREMDSIRFLVQKMKSQENALLTKRLVDLENDTNRTILTFSIGFGLSFIILILIFSLLKREISERQRAEEEIRQGRNLLDSIIENIPAMIFLKDAKELRFMRLNKAGEELIGFSRNDLIGKNDYDFFPKEEADFFTSKDREVLKNNQLLDIPEEPIQTRKNGMRLLHTKKISLFDEQGEPRYLLGISEDITDRNHFEQALKQSEERFSKIFRLSPVPMSLLSCPELRYIDVNDSMCQSSGFSREELIGRTSAELGIIDRTEFARTREEVESAGSIKNKEFKIRNKSGELRDIIVSAETFEIKGEKFLLSMRYDITERKEAEEEMRKLNSQLESVNKELEAFSYSVSHDLRAPLRHVNGFVELMTKHAANRLDDQGKRYLSTIGAAAKKMGVLIDDLLVFSRMGRVEMMKASFNLGNLVDEVLHDLQDEIKTRTIEWQIEKLPDIQADRSMMRQVMFNLISNAVKYSQTRDYARIEIGTTTRQAEIVVFIRDNGVGFDMKYVDKLFGVFQRLHSEAEFEGTGIGLASVRRIINRHGGKTWAEGIVNNGATIYFSLPKTSS